MHIVTYTTHLKQWEERFDLYIYIYILVLVSVLCINPWIAYTEEIKQLWKVLFISTWNNKNKKNNHNELKSNQYGWVEDDDPICFS